MLEEITSNGLNKQTRFPSIKAITLLSVLGVLGLIMIHYFYCLKLMFQEALGSYAAAVGTSTRFS